MTWAKTKKLDSRSKLPLRETDYRKRRTHINFQQHIELEKEVATVRIHLHFPNYYYSIGHFSHSLTYICSILFNI